MIWVLYALILFAVLIFLLEALRLSGQLSRARYWILALGMAAPLILGTYIWRIQRYDCGPTPLMLDVDLSNANFSERYVVLKEKQTEAAERLRRCGGTPLLWNFFINLETVVEDLESALDRQLLIEN